MADNTEYQGTLSRREQIQIRLNNIAQEAKGLREELEGLPPGAESTETTDAGPKVEDAPAPAPPPKPKPTPPAPSKGKKGKRR